MDSHEEKGSEHDSKHSSKETASVENAEHKETSHPEKSSGSFGIKTALLLGLLVLLGAFIAFDISHGGCNGKNGSARDNCFYEQGYCGAIDSDSSFYNICVSEVAVSSLDVEGCMIIDDLQSQGNCLTQIAKETVDVEICYLIEDDYWADNCFYGLSGMVEGEYYCVSIGNEEQRTECYVDYVIETLNPELCGGVGLEKHDRCILTLVKYSLDVDHCEYAKESFNRDVCILRVVKLNEQLDESICETMAWSGFKEDCEAYYAQE